jgi:glucokinase
MNAVLAVDIGGTKLAAGIVAADGTVLARAEVPTPAAEDADVVAKALAELMRGVTDRGPSPVAIGIGSAGPIDVDTGTVSPVNIPAWRGFPIVEAMSTTLPVALAGDGHCMALGEHHHGHQDSRALLGMVVSTGVGGGLVVDGRIYRGPTGNAGHIGHIVVDLDGPPCACGGRGCVEAVASGPAMVRWAAAHGWPTRDARALARDAARGHETATRAFRRAAGALAAAVVSAAALVDLDDVVIGGGVAEAGEVIFAPLRAAVGELAGLPFVRRVRIHASQLGRDAGLLGAAALAFDALPGSRREA